MVAQHFLVQTSISTDVEDFYIKISNNALAWKDYLDNAFTRSSGLGLKLIFKGLCPSIESPRDHFRAHVSGGLFRKQG